MPSHTSILNLSCCRRRLTSSRPKCHHQVENESRLCQAGAEYSSCNRHPVRSSLNGCCAIIDVFGFAGKLDRYQAQHSTKMLQGARSTLYTALSFRIWMIRKI